MTDRWRHRRRLVYFTIAFAANMILIGAFDWADRQVSSQLVIGGVSLISLILTGYVFAATFDDRWQRTDRADFYPQDRGSDADGLGSQPPDSALC